MFSGHSPQSGYSLSDEAIAALQSGDTEALIRIKHAQFGVAEMMADGDDDDDDDDDTGSGGDGNDDDGDSGSDDGDDDDDDYSGDDDVDSLRAKIADHDRKKRLADQRASKAEAEAKKAKDALKKIEDSKKDDLTKTTERVEELEGTLKEHEETITSLRLENAFLTANKHSWHKPAAALRLAQVEGYLDDVISDDGTVDSKKMSSALDRLAKENAYLVKTGGTGGGASGDSAGGRSGNGKDDKAQAEADRRRAPALNRRG